MQALDGKGVVVTGAGAGVGRATARAFARQHAAIGLLARGEQRLEGARRVEEALGPIDVWVNHAMTTIFAPIREIRPDEYRRATEVTYLGAVWGTMAALRRMRERGQGTIVQVGSALAYRAIPLQAPYCGAKHALRAFTDSLRSELLHEKSPIRLTMVHLPGLDTPPFEWCRSRLPRRPQPVPPIFEPQVAADAVIHAVLHHRREYFVGWPAVKVILGNKLAPAYIDRYLARTGFASQQTDEPLPEDRPDNLFEPVPGDDGGRGRFGARSHRHSVQFELDKRRGLVGTAVGLIAAGLLAWILL